MEDNSTNRTPRTESGARLSPPTPKKLLEIIKRSLDDDKAQELVVIELKGKTSLADYMVIASGTSIRHVAAMAEHLRERVKAGGVRPVRAEGLEHCDWVLIDAGDVIVHLFRPEVRVFYNLEKMWGPHVPASEADSSRLVS